MIEAALALALACPRDALSAAGAPPPLLHFEISDMTTRVTTHFGLYRGCRGVPGPFRIDRSVQRGEANGGRASLPLDECPALRPLLEQATRRPWSSPALARMTLLDGDGPRDLIWYRIAGVSRAGSGELGRFELTAVERQGAAPSPLAIWAAAMAQAYQACLDRRGSGAPADAGAPADD